MKCIVLIAYAGLLTTCQLSAQDFTNEINEQVWSPFIQAYNTLDAEAFMAVHADDVMRVTRDSRSIRVGEEYARDMRANCESSRERGVVRSIALSFIERIHSEDHAFEVGYYQVLHASGGQQQAFYGKFHVVLKKTDGHWKITLDSDTAAGGSIGEEDFLKGEVLNH